MINIIIGGIPENKNYDLSMVRMDMDTRHLLFEDSTLLMNNIYELIIQKAKEKSNILIYNFNSWYYIDYLVSKFDNMDRELYRQIMSQIHFYCYMKAALDFHNHFYEVCFDELRNHWTPSEILFMNTDFENNHLMWKRIIFNEEIIFGAKKSD